MKDSGTPTALTATQTLGITIAAAPAIVFTGTMPATASYYLTYAGSAAASGGGGTLTYSSTGSLPTGLSMNTSTGAVTGTPTAVGTFSFTVKATDAYGDSATQAYTIVVSYAAMTITTGTTLPAGYVGSSYSQTLAATGGTGVSTNYTWVLASGSSLPVGLSLSAGGAISGKPTGTPGTATFTVKVTDTVANLSASSTFSLTVSAGVSITTGATLPAGYVGSNYSQTLAATGGTGSGYAWTATSSNLSSYGLSLSTAGVVSGTPTTAGTASFTAQVTDSGGNTATAPLTIAVYSALTLPTPDPSSLPSTAFTGASYFGTITASGGSGSYSWTVTGLPSDGLSASSSGGSLIISGTATSAQTVSFGVSVKDTATGVSVGPYTYSIVVSTAPTLTLAAPNPTSLGSATIGVSYTGYISASGGVSPYTWTVNSTSVPTNGTLVSLGQLSASNTGGDKLTISGTPSPLLPITVTFTASVKDSAGNTAGPYTYTIYVSNAPITLPAAGSLGNAVVNMTYGALIIEAGGSAPFQWTVTGLSDGLTAALLVQNGTANPHMMNISGTPTTAETVSFTVFLTDSKGDTAGPVAYTIDVSSGPNGAHNSYLSGTYVCKTDGFSDSDGSRFASLGSFQADGNGHFTGGVFDMNWRDLAAALSGTSTGTYSIGADNNGLATITSTATSGGPANTNTWAIALNNLAGPTASEFRMVEVDDVGASPSGQHSVANCYLATTSAFAASTISGNSFAFGMNGENSSGIPEIAVGRFSASNGNISTGVLESELGGSDAVGKNTLTGTYTTPNATTGRFTLTLTPGSGSSANYAAYIIDANRMFLLETDAGTTTGTQAGEMRKQQQSSYSAANLNGPFVLYNQGYEYNAIGVSSSVWGYESKVYQGTGNGTGGLTINLSYEDWNGTYSVGTDTGAVSLTFDSSNPGRVTFVGSYSTGRLYLFNTNQAFEMEVANPNSITTTPYSVGSGWMEAQTQTTFTDAAVAGNYMEGQLPLMQTGQIGSIGEFSASSGGNVTANTSEGGEEYFNWDQAQTGTFSWLSNTNGTFSITPGSGTLQTSCAVISSTRSACIVNTDNYPSVEILQQ
jgi:hypothetical protein